MMYCREFWARGYVFFTTVSHFGAKRPKNDVLSLIWGSGGGFVGDSFTFWSQEAQKCYIVVNFGLGGKVFGVVF